MTYFILPRLRPQTPRGFRLPKGKNERVESGKLKYLALYIMQDLSCHSVECIVYWLCLKLTV